LPVARRAERPAPGWGIPFPDLPAEAIDEQVADLLAYRIKMHNDHEGGEAEKKLIAMGPGAVPTLIYLSKVAANSDPRIRNPEENDDYGPDLHWPVQVLVAIGDRRAIPLLSALVKYDHPKPLRMQRNLAELLCHGSDAQIEVDAGSSDPNVAAAAQMVLRDPMSFAYVKSKFRSSHSRQASK
jgi:hypothetical protein